jgi:GntR family transcriptional regulator
MALSISGWTLEFHSGIPVYKQIMNHIAEAIASGALKEGDQLPTIRTLHEALKVNPNTVAKAYRELEHMGLINSQRGSGSFVAPAQERTVLTPKEKKARINALFARMTAEAKSYGIQAEEIINHISGRKSHA